MNTPASYVDCLIVGAGLAGLCAAHELAAAGLQTLIVEKEPVRGGRMATERFVTDGGVVTADTGAQYFTVREDAFGQRVKAWVTAGVARRWSTGFATPDRSAYFDGYPRYCGSTGMASIPAYLSQPVTVRLESEVASIDHHGGWQVLLAGGERLEAAVLLLTPPVPHALSLLATGGIALPPDDAAFLRQMDYDPCLAIVAVLAGPSRIPAPGGLWPGDSRIYWMADNQQKGISALPTVTIHATPEYSRARWEADSIAITAELLAGAAPWLGSEVVTSSLRRWRYSIPLQLYPARTLLLHSPSPVALAGDAFAGPRVEGAALSGIAAGKALAAALTR